MPELRRDPIIGRWIIIAKERTKQLSDFYFKSEEKKGDFCPFCKGNEDKTPPEIMSFREPHTKPNQPGWWIRVVPNKFPALQVEGNMDRTGVGMYDKMNGIGAHEVIIEGEEHNKEISNFSHKLIEDLLLTYQYRIVDLKRDKRFRYILIFKNYGLRAGASVEHPHSQLIATPVVPKRVNEEIDGARRYYEYKERCIFCDMINQELEDKIRVIYENDNFISIEPFAARFPFETWILPKLHSSNFEETKKEEFSGLADILKKTFIMIDKTLNNPSFNYLIHNSTCDDYNLSYYHWHFEIMPKLIEVAGFEWGTGFYINPISPEDAAKYLKKINVDNL